jgi:hypothetical protein
MFGGRRNSPDTEGEGRGFSCNFELECVNKLSVTVPVTVVFAYQVRFNLIACIPRQRVRNGYK